MASTYSDRLKLELMETGANANTWGNNTNTNLETLDAFTAGYLSKSVAGSANVTLTTNNADPTAESSNKVIEFSGALTGNIYVFIPAVENNYIFFNNTSGAYTLTIAPTGHAANGVAITQGAHTIMYNNANNEIKDLFSGSLGNLSLVSGGVFTGNASGASALNASNVSSGTLGSDRLPSIPDAKLSANVTLNNASTISAGTLSNDRLDTVPTTKGGTGLTTVGSAGQVLTVASPGSTLEFADAGGFGGYNLVMFNSPGTYNPPADLNSVKVTVQAGGGGSGGATRNEFPGAGGGGGTAIESIPVASIPGPVSVTVGSGGSAGGAGGIPGNAPSGGSGGTSSFGSFCSATGGGGGAGAQPGGGSAGGAGGNASGGDFNVSGTQGDFDRQKTGGGSMFGQGGGGGQDEAPGTSAGIGLVGGKGAGAGSSGRAVSPVAGIVGQVGGAGFVMVEEYLG